ncbi:hypothetical protein [Roseomonas xinghualingensis]|uniref:hypothetical protein n=1 Tax=Roseomonas xinghualingensis TaxID=2986475 RepID=UPI0021F10E58|nr:hypothetical protein [Roseomonas sp. SXEYE001]MCV4205981.1 hypothetical protein [Roseomonas sp. SXEYE001]
MHRIPIVLRHRCAPLAVLLTLLTLGYVGLYFADPALPANNLKHPEGWWGWWDQSQYIKSARALAAGDLSPGQHWYPTGYALLGAPFARLWPAHPFFLVNLASLLITAWAFLGFARRVGVRDWWAVALFLGSVMADPLLFRQWAVPWNTSPATAAIWVLLRLAADHMAGERRPVLIGALVSIVGLLRPTDVLPAVIILGAVGLQDLWARRLAAWDTVWRVALGGIVVAGAGLALHVAIHGMQPSAYMTMSSQTGFSFHGFGWKAFNLLVAPQPWWGAGQGLIARHPWIGLAFIMLPFALTRGPVVAMLAVAAVGHLALYIAYVDLLPTGFWLFMNVHYMKWMGPGFALLAWVGVAQALGRPRGWPALAAASAAILLVMCVRTLPVPAQGEARWRGIQIPGPVPGMNESYFKMDAVLQDAEGVLRNVTDMRLWPVPQGVRLLALRREIVPAVAGLVEGARPIVERVSIGWPCWLPGKPRACRVLRVE